MADYAIDAKKKIQGGTSYFFHNAKAYLQPQRPMVACKKEKRGTDYTTSSNGGCENGPKNVDAVNQSTQHMREPSHRSCIFNRSFSHFHSQVEHNASLSEKYVCLSFSLKLNGKYKNIIADSSCVISFCFY